MEFINNMGRTAVQGLNHTSRGFARCHGSHSRAYTVYPRIPVTSSRWLEGVQLLKYPTRNWINGAVWARRFSTSRNAYELKKSNEDKYNSVRRPLNVLFFGTDDYSIHVFERLASEKLAQVKRNEPNARSIGKLDVFTTSPGRNSKSPLYKRATGISQKFFAGEGEAIKCFDSPMDEWVQEYHKRYTLKEQKYDIAFVASFGKMIPEAMIDAFPLGIINFHPSLLPQFRGAAPMPFAILKHREITGVSAIRLLPHEFDNGPILMVKEITDPCAADTDIETLTEACGKSAGELAVEYISTEFKLGNSVEASGEHWPRVWKLQDETKFSRAPLIRDRHRLIRFEKQSATLLEAKVRAYGKRKLYTFFRGKRFAVNEVSLPNEVEDLKELEKLSRLYNGIKGKEDSELCFDGINHGEAVFSGHKKFLYVFCAAINYEKEFGKGTLCKLESNRVLSNDRYSILKIDKVQIEKRPAAINMRDLFNGYFDKKTQIPIVTFSTEQ